MAGNLTIVRGSEGIEEVRSEALEALEGPAGNAMKLTGPSRSLKANVLWLDANPDAKQALLADAAGKVRGQCAVSATSFPAIAELFWTSFPLRALVCARSFKPHIVCVYTPPQPNPISRCKQ